MLVSDDDFFSAIGDKIGLPNEVYADVMILFEGSVMHVAKLKAQLRAGKEAESQFFVYLIPFLERDGADGFWHNSVQCSVLRVTIELPG